MTKSRKHEPWREALLEDLTDENEDERRDFQDPDRNLFESKHGPTMGTDGDDSPVYAQPKQRMGINSRSIKVKLNSGKTSQVEVIGPGDIVETVSIKPSSNPAGEMVDAGHGFGIDDRRSRPWKTAKRTHCAYCAGELPSPVVDASKYRCEFDPDASDAELEAIGEDQPRDAEDDRWRELQEAQGTSACRHAGGCTCGLRGCRCSGCTLRWQVANGHERNKGQPRMCCSDECTRLRDNERTRWKRAVARAEMRGETPPPEPEDRGLKLTRRNGLRSSIEGTGHRYTAATDSRLPWGMPRA